KGIADSADVKIADVSSQTFTEAAVEAAGGIMLTDLITDAKLTDIDGSESLTFKVELPAGLSLNMGSVVSNGVWSLTSAQLLTAKLITPENFSGSHSFNFSAID